MKSNSSAILKDLIFMVKLTTLCTVLLLITRAAIGEKAELSIRTADCILQITGKKTLPSEDVAIEGFNKEFTRIQSGKIKLWKHKQEADIWACEATGNGMWGEITLVYVINSKKFEITGLRVIEQKETAGLGAKISEEEFGEKFTGLNALNGIKSVPIRVMNNEFDSVSGATVSSKSVEKIVNKSLNLLRQKLNEQ